MTIGYAVKLNEINPGILWYYHRKYKINGKIYELIGTRGDFKLIFRQIEDMSIILMPENVFNTNNYIG